MLALSENGVAVGVVGIGSPARWVNGKLDWYDEKLSGEASCVSDDGEWLGGNLETSTVPFRKHANEPLEELTPLQFENLETVSTYVAGIRSDGTAVGICTTRAGDNLVEHAVRWSPDGHAEALFPLANSSAAYGINEGGTIVGAVRNGPGGLIRPFVWRDGAVEDPAFGLDGELAARAISANGNVVGSGYKKEFGHFWFFNRGGQVTFIPLNTQTGGSTPSAVNDTGLVVGNTQKDGPVAWLNGHFYPLNPLTPRADPASITSARDVNRYAEIAANGYERVGFINERFSANVLTPVREGADLQGSVADLRVRSARSGRRKLITVTGKLRAVNAGSAPAPSCVAALELETSGAAPRATTAQRLVRLPQLAPGQSQTVAFSTAFIASRHVSGLLVTLDSRNRVLELNKSNNLIEASLP